MSTAWNRDGDVAPVHLGSWLEEKPQWRGSPSDLTWLLTEAGRQAKLAQARQGATAATSSEEATDDYLIAAVPAPFVGRPARQPISHDLRIGGAAVATRAATPRSAPAAGVGRDQDDDLRVTPLAGLLLAIVLSLPIWVAFALVLG